MLRLNNVSVAINSQKLLQNIHLEVAKGDYVCLLGQNGAGKTTLLNTLMGMVSYQSGRIDIDGNDYSTLSQKQLAQRVSYVAQSYDAIDYPVSEFIKIGRYPYQQAWSHWQQSDKLAFEQAVEATDISALLSRSLIQLSGGERQRVLIAAALCQQTDVLLLDEPTNHLDPAHQVAIHQLIVKLNDEQKLTVIEASHDINHAIQHSRHILALKAGKMVWHGESDQLLSNDQLTMIYDHPFTTTPHPETGQLIAFASEYKPC